MTTAQNCSSATAGESFITDNSASGYLELGFGLGVVRSPFYSYALHSEPGERVSGIFLEVNARYEYKQAFVELYTSGLEGFYIGYNFANTEYWSADLVGLPVHDEISAKISGDLQQIHRREADFMAGVRTTLDTEQYTLQFYSLVDASDVHGGYFHSLRLARHWQYTKWNFHALAGASYHSERVMDYYYSIDPDEASAGLPVYNADAGFSTVFEAGATYPLAESWVAKGYSRILTLDRETIASPLVSAAPGYEVGLTLNYVF